ncbi:vitamin B12-dependent ribonucleotide reductase [Natranaerobius trueperi]|uniref:Vitamin B12-dependent ribonucleotide reductase n=1 Tax=Natranaerobius trueperi TaxID=759412 RepID=A0A226BZW9_9FIRM|nr:vitamin B12-dependent ribonucleotide reductase [Natranaerobius trueperi]OWZ84526.1 ribonucleoside-diphosphate reductase, adenosylcobalamin-dependent [Natranaerobius trueperi]
MELSDNAQRVLEKRYLKIKDNGEKETPEELFKRVANNIAQVESDVYKHDEERVDLVAKDFFDIMNNQYFMPNSPTLMNAGKNLQQLAACFVLPIEDSMESIFETIKNAALIHKSGGGTGFSFSELRPKNDIVSTTGGVASGPVSFMKVFNSATEAVKQGGTRRGANMGILRVDHPDILDFITCKRDNEEINNFNISVGITNEFMEAVKQDTDYSLVNPNTNEVTNKLRARDVFDKIVEMAWSNGEPGIVFIDRINEQNPTPKVGQIQSTNPCGEQPLLSYEACNLGSVNLSKMVTQKGGVNYQLLKETVRKAVHFLDNVIDANNYPLKKIEEMSKNNRKIGLGVMGYGDMLYKLGVPYNSQKALDLAEQIMSFIDRESKEKSRELVKERGAFPNFKNSVYEKRGESPIRNATTTTIAPTGTISIISGTSSGIEPLFALAFTRNVLNEDKLVEVNPIFREATITHGCYSTELMEKVADSGGIQNIDEIPGQIKEVFVTSHDIAPEWHLKMQAAFQKYTDNAVSKTVNLPNDATLEDVYQIYNTAYDLNCKGVTVYRDGSRESQVLQTNKPKKVTKKNINDIEPRKRPDTTKGFTEKVKTGCGNLYVTVNEDEEGLCEVFASMGKSGGCAASQSEATARLVSLALRSGLKVDSIIKEVRGIRCPNPAWNKGGGMVLSCPDAIGIVLDRYLNKKEYGKDSEQKPSDNGIDKLDLMMGACPDCGSPISHESGCTTCYYCGYSRCS